MKAKTILLSSLTLFGIYKLFATGKAMADTYERLQFKVRNLRNFNIDTINKLLKMTFNLEVINPTANGIGDLFGFVKLQRIEFYTQNGIFIGTANLPDKKLFVNGNSRQVFENINLQIPISNIGLIVELFQNFPDVYFNYVVTYEFAGSHYTYTGTYDPVKESAMNGLNAAICYNRAKCPGLKKNGQLKRGYRFIKGGAVKKV